MTRNKLSLYGDRWDWVESLRLSDRYSLLLTLFARWCDDDGVFCPMPRSIELKYRRFPADDVAQALRYFLHLGIISHAGMSARFGEPAYRMHYTFKLTEEQTTLDQHGMVRLIENLPDLKAYEHLILERLVMRHFDWSEGLVAVTADDVERLMPRWKVTWTRKIIRGLCDRGYLVRAEATRRGYGNRSPQYYRLDLPNIVTYRSHSRPNIVTYKSPSSEEDPNIVTYRSHSRPNMVTYKSPSSETFWPIGHHVGDLPYSKTETSETSDYLPSPPPRASGEDGEDTFSASPFFQRLLDLDRSAAFDLAEAAAVERDNRRTWHPSHADSLLDDYRRAQSTPGIVFPARMVIADLRTKAEYLDLRQERPSQDDELVSVPVFDSIEEGLKYRRERSESECKECHDSGSAIVQDETDGSFEVVTPCPVCGRKKQDTGKE